MVYNKEIKPVLDGKKELPDIEIEWAFIDLTLCRIIAPQNYAKFKEIVMTRIEFLHSRDEPNLAFYYDRLDEIIGYMEGLTIEELKSCKIQQDNNVIILVIPDIHIVPQFHLAPIRQTLRVIWRKYCVFIPSGHRRRRTARPHIQRRREIWRGDGLTKDKQRTYEISLFLRKNI